MNEKETGNKQIEELLRKAHPPGPSPQLQQRITLAAKNAWNQNETELSWLIPFGRLVASAAATILIIWLTDYYSESSLAQWQNVRFTVAGGQTSGFETLPEIPYSPVMRRLTIFNRRSSMIDTSALNDHIEALRNALDETQPVNNTKPSTPADGGSSLAPNRLSTGFYS